MESWKDNLTKEQLNRIDNAKKEAMKILDKNIPLINKLEKMKKKYYKKYMS